MLDPASDELERLAVVSGVDIGQLAMAVLRTENGGGWVNGFVMDGVSLPTGMAVARFTNMPCLPGGLASSSTPLASWCAWDLS